MFRRAALAFSHSGSLINFGSFRRSFVPIVGFLAVEERESFGF
jgi:hypothetical protein